MSAQRYTQKKASGTSNDGVVVIEHIKGNVDANVTLAKHGDFQCPHCAAVYPVINELLDEMGDVVRFEYKHLPLAQIHPHAISAAQAAEAAGQQGKFFEFHDLLYDNQGTWSRSASPKSAFVSYAQELDLNIPDFKRHSRSTMLRNKITKEMNEALRKGFTGTPTLTINGEKVNYSDLENLRNAVQDALDKQQLNQN